MVFYLAKRIHKSLGKMTIVDYLIRKEGMSHLYGTYTLICIVAVNIVYLKKMKSNSIDMTARFLIAVPGLDDPNFKQSVVLICEHTQQGAFGLIVNKVLMNSFIPLMEPLEIQSSLIDMPVYYGGPVRPEQGHIVYAPFDERYVSIRVSEHISVTASKEILHDIAEGRGPENFLFTLGFSGWDANQLEEELITNSWIEVPLDKKIIFDVPVQDRWRYAAGSIGLDIDRYINSCGSA